MEDDVCRSRTMKAVFIISGTSSGVGKTTVTVGLMAAFASRGYIVQPFKVGPDFLDGMHHEAAIQAGHYFRYQQTQTQPSQKEEEEEDGTDEQDRRRCVNLDGWMMGNTQNMVESFHRHAMGADVCIIEGCMGLHDSKDGTCEDGSTAQIAKLLNAPVILVVDGSAMARSVAAMTLGYALYDTEMRLGGVIANKVNGPVHIQWIRESIETEGRLQDAYTHPPVSFIGALPHDSGCFIPERHLGLTMPKEEAQNNKPKNKNNKDSSFSERCLMLARMVEQHLDLDHLLQLGAAGPCNVAASVPYPIIQCPPITTAKMQCRIGIADDEAFCFYYRDNLYLLQMAGAELVPFSPLQDQQLPPRLDAIYLGGGYPELHASKLEQNEKMRKDIRHFSQAGGMIFAECGGFMYLSQTLLTSKDDPPREMCGVFPLTIRMTPHAKMYYANIQFAPQPCNNNNKNNRHQTPSSPWFPPPGGTCRGQRFHFSEVFEEQEMVVSPDCRNESCKPLVVTPVLPGAQPEAEGYRIQNTMASYFHLHFSSFVTAAEDGSGQTLADHLVRAAVSTSSYRKAYAVSFVSAATEIIFALGAESALTGVTSVCDYPPEAQHAPRTIVCQSPLDASKMTSEEVEKAMQELKLKNVSGNVPPGHWWIDTDELIRLKPKVAFVQNTCDICDASKDDVLYALQSLPDTQIIPIAPTTLKGMLDAVATIASVLNIREKGEELIQTLRSRLCHIQQQLTTTTSSKPKVLSLEGLSPLCVGGHWMPDLKEAAGCVDALGDLKGCPSRIITWDEILVADPDILVLSPCSASPSRTLKEIHLLASSPDFWKLRSVQQGNVYIFDHGSFSRPGPRLVDAIEMMAALFHNIYPLSHDNDNDDDTTIVSIKSKWAKHALKYQCQTTPSKEGTGISHCTTDLGSRFTPCFEQNKNNNDDVSSSAPTSSRNNNSLTLCQVTPNLEIPANRSAHCILPVLRRGHKHLSLLLFGGENIEAQRLYDVWELHAPRDGWTACSALDDPTVVGSTSTWERLMCGKVVDEDVPTPRSNHAMVACGEHIVVFGGWSIDNMTPLSHCELLHTDTLCWTHCSTQDSQEPSPRGNPTLVYQEKYNRVILFGGWNGKHALNDVWTLNMNQWQWHDLSSSRSNQKEWPRPRTDHTSVLWEKDPVKDVMLVFGGNLEGVGPTSELWGLDLSLELNWSIVKVNGPHPPPRTSHTAAIIGSGSNVKMMVVGGTSSERGTGPASMLCDAWILELGGHHDEPAWMKLNDWNDIGLNRCRHSMAVVNNNTVLWWGGYNGNQPVDDEIGVWRGSLTTTTTTTNNNNNIEPGMEETSATKQEMDSTNSSRDRKCDVVSSKLQERWQADIPMRESDLPLKIREKAKRSTLPGALYKAIHRHAVANKRDTYIDPASGYSVFTSEYLKRRPCCGNGCRHCPYGHVNVPGRKNLDLDW